MLSDYYCSTLYDTTTASDYITKRERGIWKKFFNAREISIARKSLKIAGNPKSVLDVPCGTGRFWEMIAEMPDRDIYACDCSEYKIRTAFASRSPHVTSRVNAFQDSAFEIPREDGFVENIFCMRLMHHMPSAEKRIALLKEFRRVASNTICLSFWVDGNYKSRRMTRNRKNTKNSNPTWNRYVASSEVIEQEFQKTGLSVIDRLFFLRYYSMQCIYVLKIENFRVML